MPDHLESSIMRVRERAKTANSLRTIVAVTSGLSRAPRETSPRFRLFEGPLGGTKGPADSKEHVRNGRVTK
jgi:hypothetical protein